MAITQVYSGSATISTSEISLISGTTSLQSNTDNGIYQFFVDFSNMTSGDEYEFRIKEKVIETAAQRTVYFSTLGGLQSTIFATPALVLMHGWDATMDLTTGTARTIAWSVRKVA